jgi:MFS family permease
MTFSQDIRKTLALVWPLLAGMFMIMVGNGLQGTLLALRGQAEGFPISVIGVIMSLYFCGYLAGWYVVPRMIKSVGHVRVFAAFASLASTTILAQGLFVNPYSWICIRMISGLSFVGLFIVAESWLNNIATNKLRGQILSLYFFVVNGGFFAGQFLINLAPVENIDLFILVSVLVSLSFLPITLADKPSPGYEEPEHLPFKKLISISPFSVLGVVTSGFCGTAVLTLGPVYAQSLGFSTPKIALFIALFVLGCTLVPLFTGWLSDRIDRRKVIITMALIGLGSSVALIPLGPSLMLWLLIILLGGCVTSVHSISIAFMNDRLSTRQITSATAALILINGIAAFFAPTVSGVLMENIGPNSFFISIATVFGALSLFGIYRAFTGPEVDVEEQGEFHPIPQRSAPGIAHIHEETKKKVKSKAKAKAKS